MNVYLLGIRHHGVGSAQYVREALAEREPDLILVEGPPELDAMMPFVGQPDLKPPVAVLAYNPDAPRQAVFYPFAAFSPEWQALQYANRQGIPVRMIDLPLAHSFGLENAPIGAKAEDEPPAEAPAEESAPESAFEETAGEPAPYDPLRALARAAGYDDSEHWWEQHVEQRYVPGHAAAHFDAIQETFTALREDSPAAETDRQDANDRREAYMRQLIRKAAKEGFQRVAVICGAWHVPALVTWQKGKKEDADRLKGLPKAPVRVTWIPWTYDRLGWASGYGAGITSPGWYDHCWKHPADRGIRWLTHVARLFRSNRMDISTAHVIEGFRLAESLAALRGLSRPGLAELNEATQTVLCFGDGILLKLVEEQLIVGKKLGRVPNDVPRLPLQADFEETARKLRLPLTNERKDWELDLRTDLGLARSRFLHRLTILNIAWGKPLALRGKGTFREGWTLKWEPEQLVRLIEQAIHGNTVENAATNLLLARCADSTSIAELAGWMQQAIPAELFGVIQRLLARIGELATLSADMLELMQAFTPLVQVSRYGNVRRTDLTVLNELVEGLITRVCIGLPNACYGLDETSSQQLFEQIRLVHDAVRLLENAALTAQWETTLRQLLDKAGVHPLITGCTCRLLYDAQALAAAETARHFGLALSKGQEAAYSAGWLEGFLRGSAFLLLYDATLWNLLYRWVAELEGPAFTELLPILRRTFSAYEPAERRQLGQKARAGAVPEAAGPAAEEPDAAFNPGRARQTLPVVLELLGAAG